MSQRKKQTRQMERKKGQNVEFLVEFNSHNQLTIFANVSKLKGKEKTQKEEETSD